MNIYKKEYISSSLILFYKHIYILNRIQTKDLKNVLELFVIDTFEL